MEQGTLGYPKDMRLSKFAGLPCSLFSDFHDARSFIYTAKTINVCLLHPINASVVAGWPSVWKAVFCPP